MLAGEVVVLGDYSTTQAAICAREVNPGLVRTCSTCPWAVRSEITNLAAIPLLVIPSETCQSRLVKLVVLPRRAPLVFVFLVGNFIVEVKARHHRR